MDADRDLELVHYEPVGERVARIEMQRAAKANAQNATMTYEIDSALRRAGADDDINVVVLCGAGKHFSAGHDQKQDPTDHSELYEHNVSLWFGYDIPGVEGQMARNRELYFETTWRWRNFPKVLIAQVQGKVIGGGMMLLSACDLVVAAEDALFADPTVNVGIPGVEYFGYPWDMGVRKAKEFVFTGDFFSARDMQQAGLVNRVVPADRLEEETMALAHRIAAKPSLGLRLAKQSINAMQDTQGIHAHLNASFARTTIGQYDLVQQGGLVAKAATDGGLFTSSMREPGAE